MKLDQLISAGEEMHECLGREHYLTLAGLKAEPEFQQIYERFSKLTSDEALAVTREIGSRPLVEWIVGNRIGRKLAPYDEKQLRWEQRAVLDLDGEKIDYLRATIELSTSPARARRIAIDEARSRVRATGLNPILADRLAAEHEEMRALGYEDYVNGIADLSGIDLESLAGSASDFLEETADMYFDSLARLARRRVGIPVGELVRADTGWMFRADQFDAAFPAGGVVGLARRQMGEMGLDALQGGRVRLDTEERPGKQSRAFCVPARVPEEVYLVIRPHGGHNDYLTFLHELWHAMHFSSPPHDAPFEARWLGDTSVTEGFAMLWDHLTLDRAWLLRYLDLGRSDCGKLTFELAVQELHLIRRYAAKIRYELLLHRSDPSGMGDKYASCLSEGTGFEYSENDYLADVDQAFYTARYLRAWQTEARLAQSLSERFDEDWYRNPRAGEFVHELMKRGQAAPADQLVREVTGLDLSFAPISRRLQDLLS